MRSLGALILSGLGLLGGDALAQSAPATTTPNAATAVNNVQAFYNQTTTFSASFEQTYLAKAYNQTKTSRGNVVFSKPGMMDWRYSNPPGDRMVSNGATLWVYDAATKQAYVQAVSQSLYPAVLSFLTGQGNLNARCNFMIYPGLMLQYQGGYVLRCDPKQQTPAYVMVLFYVDAATSQIRRVLILDGQGNRNRFDFDHVVVNPPVSPQQFTFTPPQGTTVIGGPGATAPPPTPSATSKLTAH